MLKLSYFPVFTYKARQFYTVLTYILTYKGAYTIGVMKDLNQYLKRRGTRWHYVRRVPKAYEFFEKRGTVYKSLKAESLELARARRDRNKGNIMSRAIMDGLRVLGLQPTPDHRLYSLRHSFEKRMLEAGLDYGLSGLLMGHKNSRPSYGDGGSMKYRRDELMKIVHPLSSEFIAKLPTLAS